MLQVDGPNLYYVTQAVDDYATNAEWRQYEISCVITVCMKTQKSRSVQYGKVRISDVEVNDMLYLAWMS